MLSRRREPAPIKGVLPSTKLALFGSAPAWSSMANVSLMPPSAASPSAVVPSSSLISTTAPASRRSLTARTSAWAAHACRGVSPLSSISSRDSETKPHFWQICRAVRRVWSREEQTQSVYTLRSRNLHVFQLLCCLLTHVTLDVRTIHVNQCECL